MQLATANMRFAGAASAFSPKRLPLFNPNSAIALITFGGSARLMTTVLAPRRWREFATAYRRCEGRGQANATIVELLRQRTDSQPAARCREHRDNVMVSDQSAGSPQCGQCAVSIVVGDALEEAHDNPDVRVVGDHRRRLTSRFAPVPILQCTSENPYHRIAESGARRQAPFHRQADPEARSVARPWTTVVPASAGQRPGGGPTSTPTPGLLEVKRG